jgi:hypothetical protein
LVPRRRAPVRGTAADLRRRLWNNHLGQTRSLKGSAFGKNVAEHLRVGRAADIDACRVVLAGSQLATIRAWIMGCEVGWLASSSREDAGNMEAPLLGEFRPPLNKR